MGTFNREKTTEQTQNMLTDFISHLPWDYLIPPGRDGGCSQGQRGDKKKTTKGQ